MSELTIAVFSIIFLIFPVYYIFFSSKSQLLGKVVFEGNRNKKIIALTFDDGPNEPYTSQILEILRKYSVEATFFPVGENIDRDKAALKKIFNGGHIIGNHSYHHSLLAPILSPRYKDEIVKAQEVITKVIGEKPILFRPPWFFRTPAMLEEAKKSGMTTVTGTFASYVEVFKVNPNKIAFDAINNARPGTILVFHDGYNNKNADRTNTVKALEIVIPTLQKFGYKFVTVPDLLGF